MWNIFLIWNISNIWNIFNTWSIFNIWNMVNIWNILISNMWNMHKRHMRCSQFPDMFVLQVFWPVNGFSVVDQHRRFVTAAFAAVIYERLLT